jgi:sialate O-acetylesterase
MSLSVMLIVTALASADVRLPAVIGDNMVLQQNTFASLWGWADAGEHVTVKTSWCDDAVNTEASQSGEWLVKVETPKASGPHNITIKGKNTIELKNVMTGEVWVCSGQSNMQWTVNNSNNAEEEIAAAKHPNIRLFYVPRTVALEPQDDCEADWKECSPETIGGFSAVAYFFGRALHRELNVPIGLIHTSWGGTPAESWTRREILESNDKLVPIVERFEKYRADYPRLLEDHKAKLEEWKVAAEKAKADGKKPPKKPGAPRNPVNSWTPSGLYNAMIAPLLNCTIQGAIWYQGESNASRAYQYQTLFPAMIENWRTDWKLGDFPFYFVQIAPYKGQIPEIREAQLIAFKKVSNTGMVVTTDIGNVDDIHPRNKQDVGKRLALWALAKTYGEKKIVCSGPVFRAKRIEGNRIRLYFDYVGSGLVAEGGELTHFTIAEKDQDFVPARAVIEGTTVVVSSSNVDNPVDVRFGWENSAEPSLFNKEGLPASPFRTDDRKNVTFGKY